jgi:hypothetical protein
MESGASSSSWIDKAAVERRVNWNYLLVGLMRRYVPKKILFAVMKRRGDGSVAEDSPDTYLATWKEQFIRRGWSFEGKHVLKIGSGRYARFALQMLAVGAYRVTLIDLYAVPLGESAHRAMLVKDCATLRLNCNDAFSRINVVRGDITQLPPPVHSKKVDLAISHSVLEHVRDPRAVLSFLLEVAEAWRNYTLHNRSARSQPALSISL